ncbi:MAG: hypothetical protein P1P86_14990 [Bacteroidales bacterium]|nr:hypothetical protein [Bacteroidales bacterium]
MKKILILISFALLALSCSNTRVPVELPPDHLSSNPQGAGPALEIEMIKGEGHNHPLIAIWVETLDGHFVQTLYVAESIGKGIFQHGDASRGFWKPGEIQRPAALPYWSHKRGIKNEQGLFLPTPTNPVPDAYTGATPEQSFILRTRLDEPGPDKLRLLFEINQTWDWNEFWTNNKFPDDEEYKTSCQPALVYAATIDLGDAGEEYPMEIIGRSHHSGASGELFTDLETLTTALHIAEKITVRVLN